MTRQPIDPELASLIVGYLDEQLDATGRLKLETALRNDPSARRAWVTICELTGVLGESLTAEGAACVVTESDSWATPPRRFLSRAGVWALAATAVLAISVWLMLEQSQPSVTHPAVATMPQVAVLTNLKHAVFAHNEASMRLGSSLTPAPIQLVSGEAQVMFGSTAVVELVGPCIFKMSGPNRGHLMSGRLRAYVPKQAHGFCIDLPNHWSVQDLGTRFDVDVDTSGMSRIEVVEGRVRAQLDREGGPQAIELRIGQAIRIDTRSNAWRYENLVVNGDFEQPRVAADRQLGPIISPGQGIIGWTQSSDGHAGHLYSAQVQAASGRQSYHLGGWGRRGGITQTLHTMPGRRYHLSFAVAGYPLMPGKQPGDPQEGDVLIDGRRHTFEAKTGRSMRQMSWTRIELDFIAKTNRTELTFISPGRPRGTISLDDVVVHEQDALPTPHQPRTAGHNNHAD